MARRRSVPKAIPVTYMPRSKPRPGICHAGCGQAAALIFRRPTGQRRSDTPSSPDRVRARQPPRRAQSPGSPPPVKGPLRRYAPLTGSPEPNTWPLWGCRLREVGAPRVSLLFQVKRRDAARPVPAPAELPRELRLAALLSTGLWGRRGPQASLAFGGAIVPLADVVQDERHHGGRRPPPAPSHSGLSVALSRRPVP